MGNESKIKVGILGASGYGAGELLRLLVNHPQVEVVSLSSSSSPGTSVAELHPQLQGFYPSLKCSAELDLKKLAGQSVIFSALPHGKSGSVILSLANDPQLKDAKFIDLSGDLRLHEEKLAKKWYSDTPFERTLRSSIAYGLPEIFRDAIGYARIIANPGCLASAGILALAPLADSLTGEVIIDAKTGTSGAGRAPQASFHHPTMNANCSAYKILEHRHEDEIREKLGDPFAQRFSTSFVPHVIPTSRGIYVTAYFQDNQSRAQKELSDIYRSFYRSSPAIKVLDQVPELRSVVGGNFVHIGVCTRGNRVVVLCALDNLTRGMASMAIQNMNLLFKIEDMCGLSSPGFGII